ncbi:hypothetical protein C0992_006321 [Termitomyces sp. T32_za158]|nr:hypothetical protein C0992_006321 [Termitomyces sp. T32_za158]
MAESISTILVVDSHGEEPEEASSLQVKQEPVEKTPLMSWVALAEKFAEQVAYQCMRNQDMKRQGYSLIDDQVNQDVGRENEPAVTPRRQLGQSTANDQGGQDNPPQWADTRRASFSGQQPVQAFSVVPPAEGRNKTPELTEATKVYNENMHQCLSSIIDNTVGVALHLPEGIKPRKAESKHIQLYWGESKFGDLENWTMDVCNHLAACQYGGDQLDRERDAQEAFIATTYTDKLGVQGFYDTLIDHAQNMSIYPDNWVMIDTFLRGIPDAMRESLICDDGLSPEVNTVEEFVAHALHYEQAHKIAKHFEMCCSETQIVLRAEPQKVGTFWACRKEVAGKTNPWVVVQPTRSWEQWP